MAPTVSPFTLMLPPESIPMLSSSSSSQPVRNSTEAPSAPGVTCVHTVKSPEAGITALFCAAQTTDAAIMRASDAFTRRLTRGALPVRCII